MKSLPIKANTLRKLAFGVTQARVGQITTGCSLNTKEVLKFNLDHACARDAIHKIWNYQFMRERLAQQQKETLFVQTQASTRESYLLNPNLGSSLNTEVALELQNQNIRCDIALIVTDGLSALAVEQHFCAFFEHFYPKIAATNFIIAPIVFAPYGRVALSDHVGLLFNARCSIIFVGERPGLSAADSMGIYFTRDPKLGRQNSDRFCISNIRPPFGLSYSEAASQLCDLIGQELNHEF